MSRDTSQRWERSRSRPAMAAGLVALALSFAGCVIAGYLAIENIQGKAGVCTGLAHGCTAVQTSPYGRAAGVPVSVYGFGLYLLLGGFAAAWLLAPHRHAIRIGTLAFVFTLAGLAYSAYLTYLEAQVINAWCIYCVASALIIASLAGVWLAVLALGRGGAVERPPVS